MLSLAGIFPPVVTPFQKEELAPKRLADNLEKWNKYDLAGYVVLGSNGENVMLTDQESLQVVETVVKNTPKDRKIIVGAGRESTRNTLSFIREVSQIGGDAVLLVTPHYYIDDMKEASIQKYYQEVAEDSSLPIILYNVPKFTGLEIPVRVIARLSQHPNIIGIKDSSGNLTYQQSILSLGLKDFQLLTGSANTLMASLMMGAVGGILALANIAPRQCIQIYQHVLNKEFELARELQLEVIRLNQLTTGIYGIGGLKYALDQAGFYSGLPRSPLRSPDETGRQEIDAELKKFGII
jgi:4-hydroxy-2-oxoglutarate aldolase